MNSFVIAFWLLSVCIGYLAGNIRGSVIGLTAAIIVSMVLSILP